MRDLTRIRLARWLRAARAALAALRRYLARTTDPDAPGAPAPTQDDQADDTDRDGSGADEQYGADLHQTVWWENRLSLLVAELAAGDDPVFIDLLDLEQRAIAEDTL